MPNYEVPNPIINSPFREPQQYWYIREGEMPQLKDGRRPALVFPPSEQRHGWDLSDGTLRRSELYPAAYEMALVNLVRERVTSWRQAGYPGVTRTTLELLKHWRNEERLRPLFFTQVEAVETVIFLREARADFLQGVSVPRDEPSAAQKEKGYTGFQRYACKMATGSGKTTVMGMLAAWSILNKVNSRGDARFSELVLIVCPNVTIRSRLAELDPSGGEASLYRTRDLVPSHLMPLMTQGRVLVTNWHVFDLLSPNAGSDGAKVVKRGVAVERKETILIGPRNTTSRDKRYLTLDTYHRLKDAGTFQEVKENFDGQGNLVSVWTRTVEYIESDRSMVERVLGKEFGGKQNILVMNDEAHHAYRIRRDLDDEDDGDEEESENFYKEATVWVEGLDRIHKLRGINMCVDLSATPYFLGRAGNDDNRPFPWVVSDFGLIDAIEAGLVKIPQLAVRDTTGASVPGYFNIWDWVLRQMSSAERGGRRGEPKPEAVLKYAQAPIAMLAGLWEELHREWESKASPRPPVFIIVCKNTKIARVVYEWMSGEGEVPTGVMPSVIESLKNKDGRLNTIRVDSKVVGETDDLAHAKSDEHRWLRFTLDTVGREKWPTDRSGSPLYPEGFEDLANKLKRPLIPPGKDVRCIVSVGMLTEGWDCNTVTHIIGLRPFMSQLLCEQVVGRGLRRASYEVDDQGMFQEEVAKVFGVPFEVVPFKENPTGPERPQLPTHHVHAVPEKAMFEITFPRVEGYIQNIRHRPQIDWEQIPSLEVSPNRLPPEVEVKGLSVNDVGRLSLHGPGEEETVTLDAYRSRVRLQRAAFVMAKEITADFCRQRETELPAHVLFPEVLKVVQRFIDEKLVVNPPSDVKDFLLSKEYGRLQAAVREAIRPDTTSGEAPELPRYERNRPAGSTAEVSFPTRKQVREVKRCHLNYMVADTERWEQSAGFFIDQSEYVEAWVKNERLGFSIPYYDGSDVHEYIPDFLVRLKDGSMLILETKGYDEKVELKVAGARRWIAAVNAEGSYGVWRYELVREVGRIPLILEERSCASA